MRFLIIRLSALGDVVTATPVARVIKQAMPEAEVVWAVEDRCADVLRGNPQIDELVVLPASKQWKRWLKTGRWGEAAGAARALLGQLRAREFDVVLDLQGLAKSAAIAAAARGRRKIMPADAGEALPWLFTDVFPRRIDPTHISSMYVSLLEPLGIRPRSRADYRMTVPVLPPARAAMDAWLAERGLASGGYVACAPGTTRPQKLWWTEHWGPLLERLYAEHGLPAVLLGGPAEAGLAETIAAGLATPVFSAVGQTRLPETAALLASARLTVSVDTGPMHMAVAVGCPTIALFGSTGPRWFQDGSTYACLHREFACWPCHRHPVCQAYECLGSIRPADVARVARTMLAGVGAPPANSAVS